ncbi:hypothetical protein C8R44DRAFT_856793 [Mycena epipterygia]|nr:hypothetical protein C8R44DRAFT_856793 [Mycena epipterygia]
MRFRLLQLSWSLHFCLASTLLDALDSNLTLFTWQDGDFPVGTYIATGVSGIMQLADHLAAHPGATITHLLVSDSTIHDVDTAHGYLSASFMWEEGDWGLVEKKLTAEEEVRLEEVRRNNAETEIRLRQAVCNTEAPLRLVLDMAAPTLETLSFLSYTSEFSSALICDGVTAKEDPRVATLLYRDYPSLHHLTLRLTELSDDWEDQSSGPLRYAPHFPALTHFHTVILGYLSSFSPVSSYLHHFPNLTHLRVTGLTSWHRLPSNLARNYRPLGWADRFKEVDLGVPYGSTTPNSRPTPANLTIIVQPGFDPMLHSGWCGTPGVEYDGLFRTLANRSNERIHIKFPVEEDYRRYGEPRGIVPLRRAMVEFEDVVRGGEGDWAVPESAGEEAWWRKTPAETTDTVMGDETEL